VRKKEIGIGITTYNRPELLKFTLMQFRKFGGDIVVIDDCSKAKYPDDPCIIRNKERLGIARSKNRCLSLLRDYKRIFLFDDDCFPIVPNWWQPFIDGGEHHYIYGCKPPIEVVKHVDGKTWWKDVLGCCMMVDQTVLKTVGGMDTRFIMWGYEHAEYSNRIHNVGLTPYPYITPQNVKKLIYSFDMFGSYEGFEWKCQSSIGKAEKDRYNAVNLEIFVKLKGGTQYCEFKEEVNDRPSISKQHTK